MSEEINDWMRMLGPTQYGLRFLQVVKVATSNFHIGIFVGGIQVDPPQHDAHAYTRNQFIWKESMKERNKEKNGEGRKNERKGEGRYNK